jgi:hypothetical protein
MDSSNYRKMVETAAKNPHFLEQLIQDPDGCLRAAKIHLTTAEKERLQQLLNNGTITVELDLTEVLALAHVRKCLPVPWAGWLRPWR